MEELKHGSEEMTQYIITTNSGKHVRLFVSAEDWKDEVLVMHDIIQFVECDRITRYGINTVTVK